METEDDITNTINETIDASVFARWRANPTYRPPGLARWAKRHGEKPEDFSTAVRADDPKIFGPD